MLGPGFGVTKNTANAQTLVLCLKSLNVAFYGVLLVAWRDYSNDEASCLTFGSGTCTSGLRWYCYRWRL